MVSNRRAVKARQERKDKADVAPVKQRNIYDEDRMVMMAAHVVELGDLRDGVASLTNILESESLELQTMMGLVMEAAQLQKQSSEGRKEVESRDAKLAALKEVEE